MPWQLVEHIDRYEKEKGQRDCTLIASVCLSLLCDLDAGWANSILDKPALRHYSYDCLLCKHAFCLKLQQSKQQVMSTALCLYCVCILASAFTVKHHRNFTYTEIQSFVVKITNTEASYQRCSQGATNTVCVWMSTLSPAVWHLLYVRAGCRYCACLRLSAGSDRWSAHLYCLTCCWLTASLQL